MDEPRTATTRLDHGTLRLPDEVLSRLEPDEEFAVFLEGDTLILKKLHPACLSELAGRAPDDEEMSLSEIAEEVHRQRREEHRAGGA